MNTIKLLLIIISWEAIYNTPESPVYADFLFNSEQYNEAITEYKRYIFEYGNSKILDSVYLQIALSYRYTSDINNSNKFLDLSLANTFSQNKISQIKIDKAVNQIINEDFNSASNTLLNVLHLTTDELAAKQASYYLLVIDVLKSDYISAKLRFLNDYLSIDSSNQLYENHFEIITLLDSAANTRYIDVKKAKLLSSFLPGLGQIYCKACIKEALNAFILNGAMVALITISIINAHYVDAAFFAYFLHLFYSGNRYKTEIICNNYNRDIDKTLQKAILTELSKPYWFFSDFK